MRYFVLLMCLATAVVAHAYNETVTSIAYNPSRMGAFDYLKVNEKLTLKSGLRELGNTAEINLYGNITVQDTNSSNHQFPTGVSDVTVPLHMISRIIPMRNYKLNSARQTFCTQTNAWPTNSKACEGNTTVNPEIAMGLGNPNIASSWQESIDDSLLIPNVYMYGGNVTPSYALTRYSRVKNIQSMYIANDGSFKTTTTMPPYLSIETRDLSSSDNRPVQVSQSFTVDGMTMNPSNVISLCAAPAEYAWIERVDDNHKKVKILACKK